MLDRNQFFIFLRIVLLTAIGIATLSNSLIAQQSEHTESKKIEYICPPCGHNCLETIYHEPGACGECGMNFVKLADYRASQQQGAAQPQQTAASKKVAVLIFDGVQIIDYTGPWEIFGGAGFEVFSVAKSTEAINTVYGMAVVPQYDLKNHPRADILLIPGGNVFATQSDPEIQEWLNKQAEQAEVVLSVCNGAFILAKSGLLNGLKATTTRGLINGLPNAGTNITIVKDVRYVDNGKIITSGGLSAGMDAALHVVERIHGKQFADQLAYGLEYQWLESNNE